MQIGNDNLVARIVRIISNCAIIVPASANENIITTISPKNFIRIVPKTIEDVRWITANERIILSRTIDILDAIDSE